MSREVRDAAAQEVHPPEAPQVAAGGEPVQLHDRQEPGDAAPPPAQEVPGRAGRTANSTIYELSRVYKYELSREYRCSEASRVKLEGEQSRLAVQLLAIFPQPMIRSQSI